VSDADPWRERHVIDLFKGLTAPFVLLLMGVTGAWEQHGAWTYLALHGTYGALWVWKSRAFGDRNWERPLRPFRGVLLVTGLLGYWAAPVFVVTADQDAPAWLTGLCTAAFGFGVFLHFAADMQKHMAMKLRPGVLLTDGLWARSRNPNYLGELLIYLSFAGLSRHWLPFALFGLVIATEWGPNILRKDRSLSRYPDFASWKARTGLILPRLGRGPQPPA